MAYTQQEQVESYIGRQLTDYEAALFVILESGVEKLIETYTARTFESDQEQDTEQIYDGGTAEIFFDNPVQTFTKIESIDPSTQVRTLIDSSDYVLNPYNTSPKTSIMRRIGVFPYGNANIIVTGTFGDYTEVPPDIQLAATIICADIINIPDGLTQESIEGYARTFSQNWNPVVQKILDNNRRVVL